MHNAIAPKRAIALLCCISAANANRPMRYDHYMELPRHVDIDGSSSIPPSSVPPPSSTSTTISTTSSSNPPTSFSSIPPTSFSSVPPGSSSSVPPGGSSSIPTGSSSPTTTTQSSTTTAPPVITVDWSTVSASTTTSVASATHDSHGFPIIPIANCWFCLPGAVAGGGIIISGVTGPGILPPPPANVEASLGFSSIMPTITLDSDGDPSYPSTQPTSAPTTMSTTTKSSSSSSCTSTTTGYDYLVTCTASASDAPASATTCVKSTVTTTGCDITTTASTTTVAACPLSISSSVSAEYNTLPAVTVVNGGTTPLDYYITDTDVPAGFTVSFFGDMFTSASASPTTSSNPPSSVPPTSSLPVPPSSSSAPSSTSTTPSSTTSPSSSPTPTTTPRPTTTTPPPSCSTVTASGAVCTLCSGSTDPDCTSIGPPAPTQTSSNNKGSSLCGHAITGDDCKSAYMRYDENRVYNAYTSYTFTNEDDPINVILPANDGCTAIFTCDNDADYATGMAGWAIIQAFDNLFANDKVKVCGSAYLSNGCHITANACSDCKDVNT
ncbi:meiotically up-regulated gene family-domain-containing protein [Xylariaceae sp. FL0255]|nr:meiotically up-regulated gene family-domain-containing protein [Xylariaceae sp. FL0255]